MIHLLLSQSPITPQEYGFAGAVVVALCTVITMGFRMLWSAIKSLAGKVDRQTEAMNHQTKVVCMQLLIHLEHNEVAKREVEETKEYAERNLKRGGPK